jgi:hypothetical protein
MVGSIVSVIQEDMVLEKDQRVLQFDSQAAEGDCGHSGCSLSMRLQSPTPQRHTSFSNATLSNSATPCGQAFKHIRLWGPLPFKPPHRGFTISFKDLPNDLKSFPLVFNFVAIGLLDGTPTQGALAFEASGGTGFCLWSKGWKPVGKLSVNFFFFKAPFYSVRHYYLS